MAELPRGEEDKRGQIPYFNTIQLGGLVDECKKAIANNKFHYIADMTGQAQNFFAYQAAWEIFDYAGETKRVIVKKEQTHADVSEKFRKHIVSSLAFGRTSVIFLSNMVP